MTLESSIAASNVNSAARLNLLSVGSALLHDFDPGQGLVAGAADPMHPATDWLPFTVPGDVHRALQQAGRIPHPFRDLGETAVRWVAEREWWMRASIDFDELTADPLDAHDRIILVCHGLDTEADVYLDGELLGSHHSMFRPATFDITDHIRSVERTGHTRSADLVGVGRSSGQAGTGLLSIRFAAIVEPNTDMSDVAIRDSVRSRHRKMQVAFGWDISSYLLTVGPWLPIEVQRHRGLTLGSVAFETLDLDFENTVVSEGSLAETVVRTARRAVVRIGVGLDQFVEGPFSIEYELRGPSGHPVSTGALDLDTAGTSATGYAIVSDPQLWWTHDLGEPALYDLTITASTDGVSVATTTARVGIRTITLDDGPDVDEPGNRFFRFRLNNVPIFARGANWVPTDLRIATVSAGDYAHRLGLAADAGMNMIRVWGGGTYEKDAFYDSCDQLGMLIWHDFMFACFPYSNEDEAFLAEAEAEARYQVGRLRSRPSLALWCGNNEAQMGHDLSAGTALFGRVLPAVVEEVAPATPYWPGSPYGGNGFGSIYDGDTHDWRGFHGTVSPEFGVEGTQDPSGPGRHWRNYATEIGRFVSEFGFAGPADRRTIAHWLSAAHQDPRAWGWQDRIRYVPGDSHEPLFETITGAPSNADEWLDFSQFIQAEGFGFGLDRFRERKPHCSGALLWQLTDCWPGFTWSIIDFDGRPKAAYFAVRRSMAPVTVSIKPGRGGVFEVWMVNDGPQRIQDTLEVTIRRFDGSIIHRRQLRVDAPPNGSAIQVLATAWGRIVQPRATYVTVSSKSGRIRDSHQVFADYRELELPDGSIHWTMTEHPDRIDVKVWSNVFVPMVALRHPTIDLTLDDNYFALHPDEARIIAVRIDQYMNPVSTRLSEVATGLQLHPMFPQGEGLKVHPPASESGQAHS